MKRILYFLLFSFSTFQIQAQQVIPVLSGKIYNLQYDTDASGYLKPKEKGSNVLMTKGDTLTNHVYVSGSGSGDAINLTSASASEGLSFEIIPSNFVSIYLSANLGQQISQFEKSDSVNLASIFFPEIGSTSFTFHIEWDPFGLITQCSKIKNTWKRKGLFKSTANQIFLAFEGSFQNRNITITAGDSAKGAVSNESFGVEQFTGGIEYRWLYTSAKNDFSMTGGIFLNNVDVINSTGATFNNVVLNNTPTSSSNVSPQHLFHGISGILEFQLNSTILYFRFFNILNSNNAGFSALNIDKTVVSIGLKANANFMKF